MGSNEAGELRDIEVRWIGPVPFELLCRALADVGVRARDDGPSEAGAVGPRYDEGWLGGELPEALMLAAGRALVRRGGRPIHLLSLEAIAEVDASGVDVRVVHRQRTVGPDGRWSEPSAGREVAARHELEDVGVGGLVADETLHQVLAEATTFEAALPDALRLPPRIGAHPAFQGRSVKLDFGRLRPLPDGGEVRLIADGVAQALSAAVVTRLLGELQALNQLDDRTPAPDLERWRIRAARRAGLEQVPAPGDPAFAKYSETLGSLTAADRGREGRPGTVCAWRWHSPGRWPIPASEQALLARLTAFSAPSGRVLEVEVDDAPPFEVEAPSPLPEAVVTIVGDQLEVRDPATDEVVVQARRVDGEFEIAVGALSQDQLLRVWEATSTTGRAR